MIKRIKNIICGFFVSPEVVCLLTLLGLFQFTSDFFLEFSKWYLKEANWVIAVGVIGGIFAFVLAQSKEVLLPTSASLSKLTKWPQHTLLKDRVYIGLLFSFMALGCAFLIFVFRTKIDPNFLGLLFIICLSISFISAASLFMAHISVKTILESNS